MFFIISIISEILLGKGNYFKMLCIFFILVFLFWFGEGGVDGILLYSLFLGNNEEGIVYVNMG